MTKHFMIQDFKEQNPKFSCKDCKYCHRRYEIGYGVQKTNYLCEYWLGEESTGRQKALEYFELHPTVLPFNLKGCWGIFKDNSQIENKRLPKWCPLRFEEVEK